MKFLEILNEDDIIELQSSINEAYNAIPTLGQTLLNIGTQGVGMYFNALV